MNYIKIDGKWCPYYQRYYDLIVMGQDAAMMRRSVLLHMIDEYKRQGDKHEPK